LENDGEKEEACGSGQEDKKGLSHWALVDVHALKQIMEMRRGEEIPPLVDAV
jgi:hypothetical protein